MGRVLRYWIVLTPLAFVTTYTIAILVFRRLDLTFVQFVTLLTVPLMQSVVMAWREVPAADAVAALVWSVARRPFAQPVLILDALVLGAGVIGWDQHATGFGAAANVQITWTLVIAAAAVAFGSAAILRHPMRTRARMTWQISVPVLLTLALEPSTSWLAAAFAHVHQMIGPRAEVVQRLAFYGPSWLILVVLVLMAARTLSSRSRECGQLLQGVVAAAVALAVTVALANFNLSMLTQPWLGLATLWASCAASSVLLAAIVLADVSIGSHRSS